MTDLSMFSSIETKPTKVSVEMTAAQAEKWEELNKKIKRLDPKKALKLDVLLANEVDKILTRAEKQLTAAMKKSESPSSSHAVNSEI